MEKPKLNEHNWKSETSFNVEKHRSGISKYIDIAKDKISKDNTKQQKGQFGEKYNCGNKHESIDTLRSNLNAMKLESDSAPEVFVDKSKKLDFKEQKRRRSVDILNSMKTMEGKYLEDQFGSERGCREVTKQTDSPMSACIDKDTRRRKSRVFAEMSPETCSSSSTASSSSTGTYQKARPRLPSYLRVKKEVACSDSEQIKKLTHARRAGVCLMMKTQSNSIDVAVLGSESSSVTERRRRTRDNSKEPNVAAKSEENPKSLRKSSVSLDEKSTRQRPSDNRKLSLDNPAQQDSEQSNQNRNARRVKFSSSQPTLVSNKSHDLTLTDDLGRPRSKSFADSNDDNVPRLVFVGDQFVGKTALITRFTQGLFDHGLHSYQVASKVIKHTKSVFHKRLGRQVKVQFWDIDGGEMKSAMKCAQRAHAVVVVYDVTNRSSFDRAQFLLESINPRVSAMLVGNKIDIRQLRRVSYEEGRILAKIHRVQYIETSVKYNHNIEDTLQILLSCVPKEYLVRDTTLTRQRSRSDSTISAGNTETPVCGKCQTSLTHKHRKDEIDI